MFPLLAVFFFLFDIDITSKTTDNFFISPSYHTVLDKIRKFLKSNSRSPVDHSLSQNLISIHPEQERTDTMSSARSL